MRSHIQWNEKTRRRISNKRSHLSFGSVGKFGLLLYGPRAMPEAGHIVIARLQEANFDAASTRIILRIRLPLLLLNDKASDSKTDVQQRIVIMKGTMSSRDVMVHPSANSAARSCDFRTPHNNYE